MKILYRDIFIATFKRTYIQDQARPIIVTSLLSYETSPYFSWRKTSLLIFEPAWTLDQKCILDINLKGHNSVVSCNPIPLLSDTNVYAKFEENR